MPVVSRTPSPDELALRLIQQELVAEFGLLALRSTELGTVLQEASATAARGLNVQLAKVLRHRAERNDFVVVAGVGWRPGVVGQACISANSDTPAGFALHTGAPVLVGELDQDRRFRVPALLREHGVQSAINVAIGPVEGRCFGILEVDSTHRHEFVHADAAFLQAIATLLCAAISRARAEAAKDDLLLEKDLLMREVHHRVKNSLQFVQGMLHMQARTADPTTRLALDQAARRIMTIGAVHHRLYAGDSVSEADVAEFLHGLLADLRPILPEPGVVGDLRLEAPSVALPSAALTALGIIVTELVTNAIKHGKRPILVRTAVVERGMLVSVDDDGAGFPPNLDPAASSNGLGMRLITTLADAPPVIDRSVAYGRISVVLKV